MVAHIKDKEERKKEGEREGKGERAGEREREEEGEQTNRKMKGRLTGCTLKLFVPLVRLHPGQQMMGPVMCIMYVSLSVR